MSDSAAERLPIPASAGIAQEAAFSSSPLSAQPPSLSADKSFVRVSVLFDAGTDYVSIDIRFERLSLSTLTVSSILSSSTTHTQSEAIKEDYLRHEIFIGLSRTSLEGTSSTTPQ